MLRHINKLYEYAIINFRTVLGSKITGITISTKHTEQIVKQ